VLNAWTVNDAATMEALLKAGLHFITTNEPELLQDLFHKNSIKN
jgi:glycerophosphoryl diester phosphodiesterase